MDVCDPDAKTKNIRKLIKLHTGHAVNVSRERMCDITREAKKGNLPMPPLVLTRDKRFLLDSKSPLTQKDYETLYKSNTTSAVVKRLAKKAGLVNTDKTIADLKNAIGRRLASTGVREPILLPGSRVVSAPKSENFFVNENRNNVQNENRNNENQNRNNENQNRANINSARRNNGDRPNGNVVKPNGNAVKPNGNRPKSMKNTIRNRHKDRIKDFSKNRREPNRREPNRREPNRREPNGKKPGFFGRIFGGSKNTSTNKLNTEMKLAQMKRNTQRQVSHQKTVQSRLRLREAKLAKNMISEAEREKRQAINDVTRMQNNKHLLEVELNRRANRARRNAETVSQSKKELAKEKLHAGGLNTRIAALRRRATVEREQAEKIEKNAQNRIKIAEKKVTNKNENIGLKQSEINKAKVNLNAASKKADGYKRSVDSQLAKIQELTKKLEAAGNAGNSEKVKTLETQITKLLKELEELKKKPVTVVQNADLIAKKIELTRLAGVHGVNFSKNINKLTMNNVRGTVLKNNFGKNTQTKPAPMGTPAIGPATKNMILSINKATTLEELGKIKRKGALILHPNKGGNKGTFQMFMNAHTKKQKLLISGNTKSNAANGNGNGTKNNKVLAIANKPDISSKVLALEKKIIFAGKVKKAKKNAELAAIETKRREEMNIIRAEKEKAITNAARNKARAVNEAEAAAKAKVMANTAEERAKAQANLQAAQVKISAANEEKMKALEKAKEEREQALTKAAKNKEAALVAAKTERNAALMKATINKQKAIKGLRENRNSKLIEIRKEKNKALAEAAANKNKAQFEANAARKALVAGRFQSAANKAALEKRVTEAEANIKRAATEKVEALEKAEKNKKNVIKGAVAFNRMKGAINAKKNARTSIENRLRAKAQQARNTVEKRKKAQAELRALANTKGVNFTSNINRVTLNGVKILTNRIKTAGNAKANANAARTLAQFKANRLAREKANKAAANKAAVNKAAVNKAAKIKEAVDKGQREKRVRVLVNSFNDKLGSKTWPVKKQAFIKKHLNLGTDNIKIKAELNTLSNLRTARKASRAAGKELEAKKVANKKVVSNLVGAAIKKANNKATNELVKTRLAYRTNVLVATREGRLPQNQEKYWYQQANTAMTMNMIQGVDKMFKIHLEKLKREKNAATKIQAAVKGTQVRKSVGGSSMGQDILKKHISGINVMAGQSIPGFTGKRLEDGGYEKKWLQRVDEEGDTAVKRAKLRKMFDDKFELKKTLLKNEKTNVRTGYKTFPHPASLRSLKSQVMRPFYRQDSSTKGTDRNAAALNVVRIDKQIDEAKSAYAKKILEQQAKNMKKAGQKFKTYNNPISNNTKMPKKTASNPLFKTSGGFNGGIRLGEGRNNAINGVNMTLKRAKPSLKNITTRKVIRPARMAGNSLLKAGQITQAKKNAVGNVAGARKAYANQAKFAIEQKKKRAKQRVVNSLKGKAGKNQVRYMKMINTGQINQAMKEVDRKVMQHPGLKIQPKLT